MNFARWNIKQISDVISAIRQVPSHKGTRSKVGQTNRERVVQNVLGYVRHFNFHWGVTEVPPICADNTKYVGVNEL